MVQAKMSPLPYEAWSEQVLTAVMSNLHEIYIRKNGQTILFE